MFAAGDVRAAENPSLTALQTLFGREHNYQVDLLHREHPHWSGDQLYQHARAIVTAEISAAHCAHSGLFFARAASSLCLSELNLSIDNDPDCTPDREQV